MPNGCMACSGAVLNWIVRELAGSVAPDPTPHAALDRLAAPLQPGADGLILLPYFLGEKTPLHDVHARGTLVGLGLHHRLGHIWRAALEGIAFGFRHHVEIFEELGHSVRHVVASDGGAGSALWMQIAADILGRPVHLLAGHPGSCLGAAYVAAVGVGALDGWDRIARELAGGTPHAALDRQAAEVPPGADGLILLPYFLGEKTPLHDVHARGTLVGLGLHHRLGHIWRAALEGVVFGFRHHVEVFEELGLGVRHVVASDGGAGSALWMQIAADVLGRPVHLLAGHPGSCLGAAYVAAVGVGALDDWDGIDRFVTPAGVVEPDPATAGAYDEHYALFRATYQRLQPLYPRLAATTTR
jgi:sugar (pentulose or hexulose) kinase